MARDFSALPNRDITDLTNFPKGRIKDDVLGVNGTPVNEQAYGDIQQLMIRALLMAGITANGNPDNVANGYQLAEAFGLEPWHNAGNPSMTAVGGGTATPDPVGLKYHKIRRAGKTINWQLLNVNIVVTGTVSSILVDMPTYISATTFANDGFTFTSVASFGGTTFIVLCTLKASTKKVEVKQLSGSNFTAGSGLVLHMNVTTELV